MQAEGNLTQSRKGQFTKFELLVDLIVAIGAVFLVPKLVNSDWSNSFNWLWIVATVAIMCLWWLILRRR